jgi:hypothetical protein
LSSSDPQKRYGVVLFHSVHGAIRAEKLLAAAEVTYKLIAVPRHISSNCGFCIRFDWTDRDTVKRLLFRADLGVEDVVALR